MTPPASLTAATSNVLAEGRTSKLTLNVPACRINDDVSPIGPHGPGSLSPTQGFGIVGKAGSLEGNSPSMVPLTLAVFAPPRIPMSTMLLCQPPERIYSRSVAGTGA